MVDLTDDKQDHYHGDHSNQQVEDHVLQERRQNVVDETNRGHSQGIGQLGGHMVQVITLRAGGGHDGGVGDGRAVVAHNRAAQSGSDGNHQHLVAVDQIGS